jgi:hypothetical protein
MPTFLALILAPSLALACQSLMYSLVGPSCSIQTRLLVHVVAALALVATLVLMVLARRQWSAEAGLADAQDRQTQGRGETRRFLAAAGTAVAALSSLVILMMWFGAWVLSPCLPWP